MHYDEPFESGGRLGTDAVEHVTECADRYCEAECERVGLMNQPRISTLQVEGRDLIERRTGLEERLRQMPAPSDDRVRRRRAVWYWTVGGLLAVAAFGFSIISLNPYHLGLVGLLYCLGIALVTPFAVDEFLNEWKRDAVLKAAIVVVFASAMIGGALLAAVRGDLLARTVGDPGPAVVIDDESAQDAKPRPSFYESTEMPLRLLMLLFAIAIDLGGGVAFHRARRESGANNGEYELATKELAAVRTRLLEVAFEVTALTNAPAVARTTFWRDFYRAMLTQTARKATRKLLGVTALAVLLLPCHGFAQTRRNVVVLLDLSTSEATEGEDGRAPFEKNVAGIARFLGGAPAGTDITVLGITADSIADPNRLLTARLGGGEDQFGDRLNAARSQLVRVWRARAAQLHPTAQGTDIIGALFLAADIFQKERGADATLAIFSDMRNATATLDLEHALPGIGTSSASVLAAQGQIANLAGVTVHVAGANGGGNDLRQWQAVKDFWMAYLKMAGARVAGYSILATPPTFAH